MFASRRIRKAVWTRSLQSALNRMTRTVVRIGIKALKDGLRAVPLAGQGAIGRKQAMAPSTNWIAGLAIGSAGPRRYRLYKLPGVRRNESLPLLVMLHGCRQDAEALAASSRMSTVAARERFFVLYPEQDRLSNVQSCWNWYDTRSGRAQAEMHSISAAIAQVCLWQAIDRRRDQGDVRAKRDGVAAAGRRARGQAARPAGHPRRGRPRGGAGEWRRSGDALGRARRRPGEQAAPGAARRALCRDVTASAAA